MAFHDAGGAAAAAPLVAELLRIYDCTIYAHDTAASVLHGLPVEIKRSLTATGVVGALKKINPNLVLTGTSTPGNTIDRVSIAAAQEMRIPSLAILDYWGNYRARFEDIHGNPLGCLPDRISVMNKTAEKEMIAEGIPASRISVSGSPRFENIIDRRDNKNSQRRIIARQHGLDPAKPWILFLSQPYRAVFGGEEGARRKTGYTEMDAARCLMDSIKEIDAQLLVRLHPREEESNRHVFENTPCAFVQNAEINDLLSACNIVTGMSTVALIDAYLMKKPVISIQPDQTNEDLCYLTRFGLIPKCLTPADVRLYIDLALTGRDFIDFGKGDLTVSGAVTNNLALIADMIRRRTA